MEKAEGPVQPITYRSAAASARITIIRHQLDDIETDWRVTHLFIEVKLWYGVRHALFTVLFEQEVTCRENKQLVRRKREDTSRCSPSWTNSL